MSCRTRRTDTAVRHPPMIDVVVDPHATRVDLARRLRGTSRVHAEAASNVFGVVGLPDGVVVIGERPHRQHRAEDSVAVDL